LGIVLTCTGKVWKTCREGTVQGPRIRDTRPYLSDQLAKLSSHFTRPLVVGLCQEGYVRQALYGRVEIAGVAEIRQTLHSALKQSRS